MGQGNNSAVLKDQGFNPLISGYGHEDTLFGFELEQNGIVIRHIDNPVLNAHLDSNTQFLYKTDAGPKRKYDADGPESDAANARNGNEF